MQIRTRNVDISAPAEFVGVVGKDMHASARDVKAHRGIVCITLKFSSNVIVSMIFE